MSTKRLQAEGLQLISHYYFRGLHLPRLVVADPLLSLKKTGMQKDRYEEVGIFEEIWDRRWFSQTEEFRYIGQFHGIRHCGDFMSVT